MSYIARRLGFYLVAAWASLTLNFFLPRLMPGDPSIAIFARFHGQLNPAALTAMKTAYGLSDDPLPIQYVTYLAHALRGDFGTSISYFPAPVLDVIGSALSWTLLLGLTALLLSFVIGSLLGVLSAWHRGRLADAVLPPVTHAAALLPLFLAGDAGAVPARLPLRLVPAAARLRQHAAAGPDAGVPAQRRPSSGAAGPDHRRRLDRRLAAGHAQLDDRRAGRGLCHHGRGQGADAEPGSCCPTPRATPSCPTSPPSACRSASSSAARC